MKMTDEQYQKWQQQTRLAVKRNPYHLGCPNRHLHDEGFVAGLNHNPVVWDLLIERNKQDVKWGEQNLPSVDLALSTLPEVLCVHYNLPTERSAKISCQNATENGYLTFTHIAIEELCEAVSCKDDETRRGELVQLAAVVVQWIEAIDRAKSKTLNSTNQ